MLIGQDKELKSVLTKFFKKKWIFQIKCRRSHGDLIIFCADKEASVYKILGGLRLDAADMLGAKKKDDFEFLVVTDFPLLGWIRRKNVTQQAHIHYYAKRTVCTYGQRPGLVRAKSYDIVPGVELGSGSIDHEQELLYI